MTTASRFLTRAGLGCLLLALVLVIGPAGRPLAQDTSSNERQINQTDVMVSVMADGDDVKVAGATVLVQGAATEISAAGANVTVRATSTGDVRLGGAQVQFDGDVGGTLSVGGASLDVRGRVKDDARIAGAVVVVNAVVGGDLFAAGATVTIGPGTDVAGDLKAGAANLTVSGHIAGQADVAGGLVTINARTDGSVIARAAQVVVNAPARISGDLIVYSLNEPVVAEGAVISGRVTRVTPPGWWDSLTGGHPWAWKIGLAAFVAAGTILAGIVLLLFGGRVFVAATEHVRHRPLSSFLFGILAGVLIPFIAAILTATVVGISVGFAILLILPLLIVFGHAIAAAGIASGILVRRHGELSIGLGLVMLIAGAIILVAIGLIPYAGPALVTIAITIGTGAFTRTLGARLRRSDPRPVI